MPPKVAKNPSLIHSFPNNGLFEGDMCAQKLGNWCHSTQKLEKQGKKSGNFLEAKRKKTGTKTEKKWKQTGTEAEKNWK